MQDGNTRSGEEPDSTVEDSDAYSINRRGLLKGISVAAASVTATTALSDSAQAAGHGYGQTGYGVSAYGGDGVAVSTQPATDITSKSAVLNDKLTELNGAE